MRRLLVVVLALLAIPALPAGALPDPGFHAPIRVVGDAMFPLVQGISGDGSEGNPFVIAGWRFEQVRSAASPSVDSLATGVDAAILIQDTTAFVVIKYNRFTAIDPKPQPLPQARYTSPSIDLVRAPNVRIEQNSFEGVGGLGSTIRVEESGGVVIDKNTFTTNWPFAVTGSSVTITRNVVTANDFGGGAHVVDSTGVVTKNVLPVELEVGASTGAGALLVQDNDLSGGVNARSNATLVELRNNRVGTEATMAGPNLRVNSNAFTMDPFDVRIGAGSAPTFNAANTLNGEQMLFISGTNGAVINPALPVAWLWIQDAQNTVLKNVHLDEDALFVALNVEGITIQDSSFGVWFDLFASGTLTLERTTLNGGFIASENSFNPAHIRLIDVTSLDELLVGLEGDTIDLRGGTYHASEWGLAADIWHDDCDNPGNIQDAKFVGEGVVLSLGVFCEDEYALNVHGISLPADGVLEMQFGRADARGNWWGNAAGPTLDGGPTRGAAISAEGPDDVLYAPWLAAAP